jgi:hypothetical protein
MGKKDGTMAEGEYFIREMLFFISRSDISGNKDNT